MKVAPLPDNEVKRVAALRQYNILDSAEETAYDDLTRLASIICGTPIALVSLVDSNRQWFKSKMGLEALETPRDVAFCAHAILQNDVFLVPDATDDNRFSDNPLVTDDPSVRFYAGVPLVNPDGYALGTLCVLDRVPRNLSPEQVEGLRTLGQHVIKQMELRRNLSNLAVALSEKQQKKKQQRKFFTRIAGGFGLASTILALIGIVTYKSINELIEKNAKVTHTQDVIEKLEGILSTIKDAETGQRGYILTGDESYLEPYNNATKNIDSHIKNLKRLTINNPPQQRHLANVELLIKQKIVFSQTSINMRKTQGFSAALQLIQTNQGKALMDNIRAQIATMQAQEKELLRQESEAANALAQRAILVFLICILLTFLILAIVYYFIYRELTERKQVEVSLNQERNFISAILDTSSALVLVLDTKGQIIRFNRACEQITGYSAEEIIGRHLWDLFLLPEDVEPIKISFEQLRDRAGKKEYQNYWLTKDGKRRLISWSNTTLKDREGQVEYIISTGIDMTDRRMAEQALQESEQRFRTHFEQAPIGIALVGLDGRILESNPALRKMLNYSEEEIQKFNFTDITYSDNIDFYQNLYNELITGKRQNYQVEKHYIRKDGDLVWVRVNVALVKDMAKQAQFCIAIVEDINERKQMEQMISQSEEKYRYVVDNIKEIIFQTNDQGLLTFLNPAWTEITGYSLEESIGASFLDYLHPDEKERIVSQYQSILQQPKQFSHDEILHRTKNGDYRWLDAYVRPILDAKGAIVGTFGTLNDITDRKRIQESLEKEREQLQQIITIAPVAMAMFDTEMRYIAYSQKWLKDYNLEGQSIIGQSHYQLFPDTPDRLKAIHQRALSGEALSNPEDILELADGSKIYQRWAIHPWRDSNGNVGGIVIVTDLINELVQAREQALEALRFKSQFLANMSHEIRTPMNGVIGMTGLLLKTDLNREQQEFVDTIRISADNLLTIINEILDFSKLEAGEMELEMLDFDLNTCIEEVADLLAFQADIKGIELATWIDKNVPRKLQGDDGRLRQIFTNLVGNAIKFTSKGNVLVRASLQSETPTTASVLFSVTDTGIGISPAGQKKLFQSFSQVDASTTRQYGGTGLGLAICKQLVEMMGGEINVESEVGQGTKFWFIITFNKQVKSQTYNHFEIEYFSPVSRNGNGNNNIVCNNSSLPQPELIHELSLKLVGKRLLVVDDMAINRQILNYQASAWGMQLNEAESATEAITAMRDAVALGKPYDVVIVDMQMPEIDGEMLGEMIFSDPTLSTSKLIMLTSMTHRNGGAKLLQKGFSSYLIKPVRESRLLESLIIAIDPTAAQRLNLESHLNNDKRIANTSINSQLNQPQSELKILLAEDNLINQKVAINQLRILGYQADCVANGQEALSLLSQIKYDIVLMDCQMPILDGYAATRELRKREGSLEHTVVIAMTANALKEAEEECLAAGMDDYISKPVSMTDLQLIIERWGDRQHKIVEAIASLPPENTPDNNSESVLDLQRLHEVSDNDPEFETLLLETFIEGAQNNLASIESAIQSNDFATVEHQAHQLKGSSANVGVSTMHAIAHKLESVSRQKDLSEALGLLKSLEEILIKVQDFILNRSN